MISVVVNGCNGKMGQVLINKLIESEGFKVVGGIDKNTSSKDITVFNNINDIKEDVDVIIDFSNRECLAGLLKYGLDNNVGLVIATTGLTNEDKLEIYEASKKIPIFNSSNTSVGINTLIEIIKGTVKALSDSFDIEIIEKHHNQKLDAPSGTAFMLANQINNELNNSMKLIYGRNGDNAKRSKNEIGIHAVRGGTIAGEHTIIFAGDDEIIELKHIALSKKIFANGAIDAARFISTKNNGLYNMSDVIKAK